MATISVILTTYNGFERGFLSKTIDSILCQTYQDFELVIVDDGSTDETKFFCEKYLDDKRVRYLYQINRGVSSARNVGIRNSTGNYVCFLDSDDIWLPEKLEKQIKFFESCDDENLGLVHTWVTYVDEKGAELGVSDIITKGDVHDRFFKENVINCLSSVMIKRNVFDVSGMFKEHMIHVEDIELWFRVAKHFSIYSVNEPLTKYRVHMISKLSERYRINVIFMQLVYYYALKDCKKRDENVLYENLYKKY